MARYELGDLVWKVTGDTKDFDKNLATSESKLSKFSTAAFNAGKKLTTFLTLPIAAAGVATVKAASDLGESLNAVNVVFGESAGIINNFGETAAESAGLSQSAFNGLATVIGAQLKQSGLAIDDVASRTVKLTERSADLASVFNVDVSEAASALGAVLRGENEPARRFGLNISDAAVQAEALALGLVKSKNEITDQIKVQARYSLILKQSNDVAGDFANTSDSLANKSRILKADLVNVSAELGEALIPIATDLVGVLSDAVEAFGDLDDGTKKLILTIAGAAAAGGPILLFVGGIGKAITSINGAIAVIKTLNTTALFGPLGLIAGLGAATAALIAISNKRNQRGLDDLSESMEGLKDSSTLTSDELGKFGDIISREISKGGKASFDELNERVSDLAEELGISEDAIIDIGLASGKVVGTYREQLEEIQRNNAELSAQAGLLGDVEFRARRIASVNARQAELERQKAQAVAEGLSAEEQALNDLNQLRFEKLNADERELIVVQEQINEIASLIERNKELGLEYENLSALFEELALKRNELREVTTEAVAEEIDGTLEVNDAYINALTARSEALENYYEIQSNGAEEEKEDIEELIDLRLKQANAVLGFASAIDDVLEANSKAEIQRLEQEVEKYDEGTEERLAAEGRLEEAKKEAARESAKRQKALQIFQTIINTAAAITEALPNVFLAALAGATGALQLAAIKATPLPAFQDGGFVQPRPGISNTGDQITARLNPGEVVLTQDDARELLSAIRGGNLGGQIVINNTLNTDSQKSMERAARQLYPYMQREAVRRG